MNVTDPLELMVQAALVREGVEYVHDSEKGGLSKGLDFFLPDYNLYIEVKQFHTDRVAKQTARVDNIIVLQGRKAVEYFCATCVDYFNA